MSGKTSFGWRFLITALFFAVIINPLVAKDAKAQTASPFLLTP